MPIPHLVQLLGKGKTLRCRGPFDICFQFSKGFDNKLSWALKLFPGTRDNLRPPINKHLMLCDPHLVFGSYFYNALSKSIFAILMELLCYSED